MQFHHILKAVALSLPIGITFVDNVGYIARVDGKLAMQIAFNEFVDNFSIEMF